MNISRVKTGQWIAAGSAVLLLLSMTLFDWYGFVGGGGGGNAFDHPGFLGGVADGLLLLSAAVAIGNALVALLSRAPGLPVALNALSAFLGAFSMALVFGRMIFQPGPNEYIELKIWIVVAMFAAGGMAFGGWISMRDEATTKPRAEQNPTK